MERTQSFKQSIKKRFPRGLWVALHLLRSEVAALRLQRKGIRRAKAYRERTDLKLNIGCGPNRKQDWVNIDLRHDVDLPLDMREEIPLPDQSAQIIYSEHFFEHLDYPEDAKRFLAECYRLLRPGGLFSLGVPDTEWPLRAYTGLAGEEYFAFAKAHWHPSWCSTPLEHINYHFRQGTEHRFAYDLETLSCALAMAGFENVRQRDFDSELDSECRRRGTLYVEARKPTGN